MKIRMIGTLGALVLTTGLVAAQTTPPIKMGLWKSTETTKISGLSLPPQVVAELKKLGRGIPGQTPHTAVYESCLTEAQWQKDLESTPHKKDCAITSRKVSASGVSTDMTCKSGNYTTTGHWDVSFLNSEHMRGVGKVSGGVAAQGAHPTSTTTTFDSRYVSASCGDVQPGASKILEQN